LEKRNTANLTHDLTHSQKENCMNDTPNSTEALDSVAIADPLPLLPRSAWSSQTAFLRAVFKAKKALDQLEYQNTVMF
jgi:hypothetical protein